MGEQLNRWWPWMKAQSQSWWPWIKALLSIAVLAFIARQLSLDLAKLPPRTDPIGYGWLALSAVLYLAGLGLSGVFWTRLLYHLQSYPGWYAAIRAYFVSQLGKYVPGKALALVMRVGMVASERTPARIAALTAFYEVLTTMAAGVLLALLLTPFVVPGDAAGVNWQDLFDLDQFAGKEEARPHDPNRGETALVAFALFAACALPLTPWFFNRLASGVIRRFSTEPVPPVNSAYFVEGLLIIAPCWVLFGLSLACGFAALPEVNLGWSPLTLGWLTVSMAIAYVGGFVVPISPGGLGIREFLLTLLLVPVLTRHGTPAAQAGPLVALVVILLRLAWTVGEAVLAGCLYLVPPPRGAS